MALHVPRSGLATMLKDGARVRGVQLNAHLVSMGNLLSTIMLCVYD